ncbi:MAG: hypothetical protein IT229_04000 [Flavobacteriales bacterium]|nr:hypothetical protein [Flavobacteriales bacterium]
MAFPPLKSSFSGIVDGRRQLASSSDSTVRYVSSEWHALPMSFALGAMARIGKLRRSSARAHHYWCLTLGVQHTWHRQTWSSTSVYSGIRKSGDDRWSDSSILFSPGIGHRSRVHGNKRYNVELRPGLQRAVGVGYHAEVSGFLGDSQRV